MSSHRLSSDSHLYLPQTSASPVTQTAALRRNLLQRTQKELIRECRFHKIPSSGAKGDIVDRLVEFLTQCSPRRDNRIRRHSVTGITGRSEFHSPAVSSTSSSSTASSAAPHKHSASPSKGKKRRKSESEVPSFRLSEEMISRQEQQERISHQLSIQPRSEHGNDDDDEDEEEDKNQDEEQKPSTPFDRFMDKLRDEKYVKLREIMLAYNVQTEQLPQINELTLQILGIHNELDRKYLLHEIELLTAPSKSDGNNDDHRISDKKQKQYETEISRLRRQLVRQQEEFNELQSKCDHLLDKYKTNRAEKKNESTNDVQNNENKENNRNDDQKSAEKVKKRASPKKRSKSLRYDNTAGASVRGLIEHYERSRQSD